LYIKFGTGRFQSWGGGPNALLERSDAVFSAYNPGEEGGTALWELITVRKVSFLAPLLDLSKTIDLPRQTADKRRGRKRRFPQGARSPEGKLASSWCEKRHLFSSFPYVCPEPVLAK